MHANIGSMQRFVKLLVLFLSGILAHALAGGFFIKPERLLIMLAITTGGLFLMRTAELAGPQLAMAILVLQSSSHFIFGGGDLTGDTRMIFSHLSAGLISYQLIGYFDSAWRLISDFAIQFLPLSFRSFSPTTSGPYKIFSEYRVSASDQLFTSLQFRGPPKE